MLRGGQLAWDAFVWRDSYGDWKAAGDSDTLVRAVAASADDEPTATAPNPTATTSYLDDEDPTRMAQSPTGENLQPVARVAFAARARATSQPPVAAVGGYGARTSQPPMNGGNGAYAGAHAFSASAAPAAAASYAPRSVS